LNSFMLSFDVYIKKEVTQWVSIMLEDGRLC
jgi:hypothetical protein